MHRSLQKFARDFPTQSEHSYHLAKPFVILAYLIHLKLPRAYHIHSLIHPHSLTLHLPTRSLTHTPTRSHPYPPTHSLTHSPRVEKTGLLVHHTEQLSQCFQVVIAHIPTVQLNQMKGVCVCVCAGSIGFVRDNVHDAGA